MKPQPPSGSDPNAGSGTPSGDQPVRVAYNPTSARVPERVARGATATAFMAFFGPNEFVIDFLQLMSKPHLVARVVMAPIVVEQFVNVLKENLARYHAQFGMPQAMPKPPADVKPKPPQEIYDELKIADDVISGVYANTVLVGHTPAEFGIDFITSFIPHAAVSARVYIAAPRMSQLIDTLSGLVGQYKKQRGELPPGGAGSSSPPSAPPGGRGRAVWHHAGHPRFSWISAQLNGSSTAVFAGPCA